MKVRVRNTLWLIAGYACLLLALIGALLPLLPTTVFLLMAAACFSRSSPKLANWLYHHPRFGPPLLLWQKHHGMTAKTKAIALSTIAVSFCFSLYSLQHLPWLVLLLLTVWLILSIWMLKLPTISTTSATCATMQHESQPMPLTENADGRH